MLRTLVFSSVAFARLGLATPADVPKYSVKYELKTGHAQVALCLAQAHSRVVFAADSPGAMHFFSEVQRSAPATLETAHAGWRAKDWRPGECLTYSADIGAIADLHSEAGSRIGQMLVTGPQYWLLRADAQGTSGSELRIELPQGWSISAPWHELGRDGETMRFQIPNTPSDWSVMVAMGRFDEQRIALPGGILRVSILFDAEPKQRAKLITWIRRAAEAVVKVYGRMPIAEVAVSIVSIDNTSVVARFGAFLYPAAVYGGESVRGQGNSVQLVVDPKRAAVEFDRDWTAIHELSHLMHPYLGDRGNWLAEGLATYYQNILRARSGILTEAQAWEHLADGFQDASSAPSNETLEHAAGSMDQSHAFQRVYWAGAAYWLTVDMDLRQKSGGKLNLETALRRFHDCCLPTYREWKPEDFVAKLDELMGVRTFSRRYREFSQMTRFPDWQGLYAQLGVLRSGEDVTLDVNATNAAIREAIAGMH